MSIDFSTLAALTVPEGVVVKIEDTEGNVLWERSDNAIVLEVEKITSDTYANSTTYSSEEFILLDIYPKTNGTVNVTYGGLTKTITDTSGAEEPSAQKVYFGTFNGVSDEVETPTSGTLTIEGDYRGVGISAYNSAKGTTRYYIGVTAISSLGNAEIISDYAFYNCTGLTSVTIPESVTSIGTYAFYNCTGLTSVTIPESVTSIGTYAFSNCTGLTSVTILEGVTSIGTYAFYNCTGLTSLTILEGVTSIGASAFYNCTGLTSVTIPSSVTSIGDTAFTRCTGLVNIAIDSDNEYYSADGGVLFNKEQTVLCAYPAVSGHYTIPESVTSIGTYAFSNCTGLTSVTILEGVTSIGTYAFGDCTGLTSVTIPSSVTSIGAYAFTLKSGNTRTIAMLSETPATLGGDNVFDVAGTNNIVVPAGSGDTYKAAEYWSEYANYITEASA